MTSVYGSRFLSHKTDSIYVLPLDLAIRHQPDIIVSDALMPRMDGFQLLRALKADPHLKSVPFIFVIAMVL